MVAILSKNKIKLRTAHIMLLINVNSYFDKTEFTVCGHMRFIFIFVFHLIEPS